MEPGSGRPSGAEGTVAEGPGVPVGAAWYPQSAPPWGQGDLPQAPAADARKWIIPLLGGLGLVILLPPIFMAVSEGAQGSVFLGFGLPLALLFVVLGLYGSHARIPSPAGRPASFGNAPFGFRRQEGVGIIGQVRALPSARRAMHSVAIYAPLAVVAVAALAVAAAIVVGPRGVEAAGAGLGILFGTLFFYGGYFLASYRPLVPAALASWVAGLLVAIQAMARAWDVSADWDIGWLFLLVPLFAVQGLASEAGFRGRSFWGTWGVIGILAAAALPVTRFLGIAAGSDIPVGLTLASLVWGVAACYAFLPIAPALRWTGVFVLAPWSVALAVAYASTESVAARIQAAGLVAAAAVAAITVALYYLMRPCPPHAAV